MNPKAARANKNLSLYAHATAAAVFLLLIAGSLVTSHSAGLAVPDWPLSYGTWFPPMVGGIFYEHGHRMIAGAVGIMILALAIWLARRERRLWVRKLGAAALLAVFIQALLGGLTVLLLLPPQVSISHACLGQTVFCLVVCLAIAVSPDYQENPPQWQSAPLGLRLKGILIAVFAALQLLLGAIVRHTGLMVMWHIAGAAMLVVVAMAYGRSLQLARGAPLPLRASAGRLLLLLTLQVLAGAFVYLHRSLIPARTLHLGTGALVLAQAVVIAWETVRVVPKSGA